MPAPTNHSLLDSPLRRRGFLRAAGVLLALPRLESRAASPASGTPSRLVAINIPLGFLSESFFPTQSGTGYVMSPYLARAEGLRDRFTVISGTSHPGVDGGHAAEKSFLTAAPHPGSRSFRNQISLDQEVLRHRGKVETRFASMALGEHTLSWSANGVAIPAERVPAKAFSKLFLQGTRDEVKRQQGLLSDGRSVLDAVLDDARAMQGRVSHADREKLDQYFTAIRETEERLVRAEQWSGTPKPAVEAEVPRRLASEDTVERLRAHFEVIRLALQTDSTRLITLGGANNSLVIPIQGVSQGYHALTHHGKNPEMMKQLERIDHETLQAWVDFLISLEAVKEPGGGTLLDATQVFLGSNLGNANGHLTNNLPVLLAGGPWKHGQHLAFDAKDNEPLPNLYVRLMQGMGLEVDRFASSTRALPGLERRG